MSTTSTPAFAVGQRVRLTTGSYPIGHIYSGPHEGMWYVRLNGGGMTAAYAECDLQRAEGVPVFGGPDAPIGHVESVGEPNADGTTTATVKLSAPTMFHTTADYQQHWPTPERPATSAQLDRLMALLSLTSDERAFVRSALSAERDAAFWAGLVDWLIERGRDSEANRVRLEADAVAGRMVVAERERILHALTRTTEYLSFDRKHVTISLRELQEIMRGES